MNDVYSFWARQLALDVVYKAFGFIKIYIYIYFKLVVGLQFMIVLHLVYHGSDGVEMLNKG